MSAFDRTFPPELTALHALPFEYDDGDGIDFEPYDKFNSASDNQSWIRAWTGNKKLSGSEYRVFGQDGTGGYAAFWLVRPGAPLLAQPIVFFGSEGEVGVVARDFADYTWVLAGNIGPCEAVRYGGPPQRDPNRDFTAFANKHFPDRKRAPAAILKAAHDEFPTFARDIQAQCG